MINRQSEPYEDVGRTLAVMAEMAQRQKTDPKIRKVADSVTGGVTFPAGTAGRDEVATRIWRFIKREIRYVLDPAGTELVQAPDAILKTRHGDCDGMATLAAAMLAGLGIESGFRAVAWEEKGVYQHVYAIYAPTRGEDVAKWHALDPVSPSPPPGPDTIKDDAVDTKDYTLAEHSTRDTDLDMAQLLSEGQSSSALAGRRGLGQDEDSGSGGSGSTGFDSFEEFVQFALQKGPEYVRAWRQSGQKPAPDSNDARLAALEQRLRNLQQQSGGLGEGATLALSGAVAASIVYIATR